MARYTGPKSKSQDLSVNLSMGLTELLKGRNILPDNMETEKRRKQKSDYAVQLMEKQKAKYTYGVLERQFRNLFEKASRKKGVTGEVLLQFLESRLDNVVFRLGISPTRRGARQLVGHKHIVLNGIVNNVSSTLVRPGDIIAVRGRSQNLEIIQDSLSNKAEVRKFGWLEWNPERQEGKFLEYPEREQIPETINEQLIVELYSK